MTATFISLEDAKDHLGIDEGLTVHDRRINRCILGAIAAAENYTQRSLSELVINSGADSTGAPFAPDPKDSPSLMSVNFLATADSWGAGYDWSLGYDAWSPDQYQCYWAAYLKANPALQDDSNPSREDARQACLLKMEMMFDRNIANFTDLEAAFKCLLDPYRIGLGV